jgi:hypothetical protein
MGAPCQTERQRSVYSPVRPEDEHLYPPFFTAVADLDSLRCTSRQDHGPEFFARFTNDYARAMQLVAIEEASGNMLQCGAAAPAQIMKWPNTPFWCTPTRSRPRLGLIAEHIEHARREGLQD